ALLNSAPHTAEANQIFDGALQELEIALGYIDEMIASSYEYLNYVVPTLDNIAFYPGFTTGGYTTIFVGVEATEDNPSIPAFNSLAADVQFAFTYLDLSDSESELNATLNVAQDLYDTALLMAGLYGYVDDWDDFIDAKDQYLTLLGD